METDRYGNPEQVMVLLDTNGLMMSAQFKIDLLEELKWITGSFRPVVIKEVIGELKNLAAGRGKDASAARYGLMLANGCDIVESGITNGPVDDRIVAYADAHNCMVVTNDRELRNRLLENKINVISLKGKRKLEIIRR